MISDLFEYIVEVKDSTASLGFVNGPWIGKAPENTEYPYITMDSEDTEIKTYFNDKREYESSVCLNVFSDNPTVLYGVLDDLMLAVESSTNAISLPFNVQGVLKKSENIECAGVDPKTNKPTYVGKVVYRFFIEEI
ncbi:MAG: hypothetical protein KatS3mg104_3052 [Phycisphaerae bacterium]|nr:MAG: hypothetical protein KatS3mg104_3052 [Phycisphaerae bacterium]